MTMKSCPVLLKLFVFCSAILDLIALEEGIKAGFGKTEPSFRLSLTRKAQENTKFRRDGVEINSELRGMRLYPYAQNTKKPAKKHKRPKRAAMSNRARRWMGPDGRPLIPYVIQPNNFADHTRRTILMAMRNWAKHVPCLRFVQRTKQRSYLSFYAGKGCFSDVGRMGGRQRVSIGQGCELLTTIIHEIGHALGFWHEQSRPDRDHYVRIYWRNIKPEFKYAFEKYADGRINSLGVPYDYDSVMHYSSTAFGQGRTTITRINGGKRLSNKKGLSPSDIKQAKLLYCGSGGTRPTKHSRSAPGCPHRDISSTCSYWARKGYCSRNSRMHRYCKKTCFCRKKLILCRDKHPKCSYWSTRGYCRTHSYMKNNCKKSCRMCRTSRRNHVRNTRPM